MEFLANRKGIAKLAIYATVLIAIFIYSTYFSNIFVFATSYYNVNTCQYRRSDVNDCTTNSATLNCPSGQYRPSFACQATDPGCIAETGSASCGAACTDCNGAGSCTSMTCVNGNQYGCASGSYCNNVGSCIAKLANGASCSDCSQNGECISGNCGNGGAEVCCDAGYRCCSSNSDCLSGYTCVSNNCKLKSIPILVLSNGTASVNTSGLVGYWRFEEGSGTSANDSSGNGNTGTVQNYTSICANPPTTTGPDFCPNWTASGYYGGGMTFDGVDDSINISASGNLDPVTNNSFTFTAWAKPFNSSIQSGSEFIVGRRGFNAGIVYSNSSQKFKLDIWNSSDVLTSLSSASAYANGNWYYIAGVIDDSSKNMLLYVNGAQVGSKSYIGPLRNYVNPPTGTGNYYIGGFGSGNSNMSFNGTIDEVQIWNRALSASEINELYQSSASYPTAVITGSNCPSAVYTNATDVTCNLYRNTTSVSNPNTPSSGYYYYLYNTSGGANWTVNSILIPISVSSGLQVTCNAGGPYGKNSVMNVVGNVTQSASGTTSNVTVNITNGATVYLSRNSTSGSDGGYFVSFPSSDINTLNLGTYGVNVTANKLPDTYTCNTSVQFLYLTQIACQTRTVYISGNVLYSDTGLPVNSGRVTTAAVDGGIVNSTSFSSGRFSIYMTGCYFVGNLYTFSVLVADNSNKTSSSQINFIVI